MVIFENLNYKASFNKKQGITENHYTCYFYLKYNSLIIQYIKIPLLFQQNFLKILRIRQFLTL
jgi:hypothetical protein